MIVHDLYVNRGTFLPAETNSPLLVDSDAELTGSVAGEFLQPITGRHAQILNAFGGFEHQQLLQRRMFKSGKSPRVFAIKYPLRFASQ